MKIRLLLASLLMTVSVFGQNVPSYVPTNGLVGWWPFNGNANDESGNGNNGTVNGATLTSDRFGNVNTAYSFDGIDDGIITSDINFPYGNSDRTISVWINNIDSVCSIPIRYGAHSQSNGCWILHNTNCNSNYPNGGIVADFFNEFVIGNNTGLLSIGDWGMITISIENQDCKLYLNGQLIGQDIITINTTSFLNQFYIGSDLVSNPNYFFKGKIDDIGIWDRALSQQEITNLYNASTSIPIIGCPGAQLPTNVLNGLVGWWPFCGDADDESGNGNNGTVNGVTLTSDRFGNGNSAYEFDGVDDYIDMPSGASSTLNIIGDHSVSFYIKSGIQLATSNASIILSFGDHNTPSGGFIAALNINPTAGGPFSYHTSDPWVFINDSISNLYWSHFLVTQNSDTLSIYMNGVLRNRVVNHPQVTSWSGLRKIGVRNDLNSEYYMGTLDDIGIWNRALDSSEVVQLYNTGLCTQTIAGSCDTLIFNANITGFNPVTYANQVKVYPNPAADNLVIDCGTNYTGLNGYSIRITNLLGQTVYNSPVTAQITNIQLNPPTWVNGTYVVQFINPNGTVMETKRIIIQ